MDEHIDTAAFEAFRALMALIANPKAAEARVLDLQRQTDDLRDAQSKLAAEREALDRRSGELDARSASLDRRETALREREVALHVAERQAEQTWRMRDVPFSLPKVRTYPGGMTQELDPTEGRPVDAHYDDRVRPPAPIEGHTASVDGPANLHQTTYRPARSMRRAVS